VKYIGFLFNHDAIHQVSHVAPIIGCLRRDFPDFKMLAFVTSKAQFDQLREIVYSQTDDGFEIRELETPGYLRATFRLLNMLGPVQRLYILKHYFSLFEKLDCLVVPEMTSSRLKTHLGLRNTSLILLSHGAGDRAIGFGEEIRHFDYVLLSGEKVRNRMLESGLIKPDNHAIVGYPKFDIFNIVKKEIKKYFDNDNPTILYNPHFDPRLSS